MVFRAAVAGICITAALSGAGCIHFDRDEDRFVAALLPQRPAPPPPAPTVIPSCKPQPEHVESCAVCTTPSIWPVEHPKRRISSNFGGRRRGGRGHKGIDMEAPKGTPVAATAAGVATFVGWHGAYGKKIVIDHGNSVETVYAHLDCCLVDQGERVQQGQTIGRVGITGNASAFHLHYEVRNNGTPVNPAPWLPTPRISQDYLAESAQ